MIRAPSTFSSLASVLTDKGTSRDETSNLEVFVKKVLLIGPAAIALALTLAPTPDARGAPVGQPAIESAVIVAQFVPAPAVVQQDVIASMADEIVVALCNKALPMEIIGITRSCDDVQEVVVANTEKVGSVVPAHPTGSSRRR